MENKKTRLELIADLQSAEERIVRLERALELARRTPGAETDFSTVAKTNGMLPENEKMYRLLVDTSNEGIWSMDKNHRTTYVNQTMADMLGYQPLEMLGRPVEDFCFVEDMEIHNKRMENRHAGEDEIYGRRFKRRDGSVLWTMVSAKVIKDEQGNFNGSFAMFTDITERKLTEDALYRHNQVLAEVVDIEHLLAASFDQNLVYKNLKQGIQRIFPDVPTIFISSFDPDRRMISAVYGSQDGNLVDVSSLPEIPLATDGTGTQSRVILTRQPLIINSDLKKKFRTSTVVHIGDDGGQVTQSALYVPMLAQDKVLGIVQLQSYQPKRFTEEDVRALTLVANTAAVSIQNARLYAMAQEEIRERQQAETALRESEEKFSKAFRSSPDSIVISTLEDGMYLDANESFLRETEYTYDEIIGHTSKERSIWATAEDRSRLVEGLRSQGRVRNLEARYRRKSGEIRDALVSSEIMEFEGGKKRILSVVRDITEHKQAEKALSEKQIELQNAVQQLMLSRNMLQSVIDSIPVRVFWKDRNLRYLGCNALFAADAGFIQPQQLLGMDDFEMVWKGQAESYQKDDREVIESCRPKMNIVEPQTTPRGDSIWLNTSKVPLQDFEGGVYGILGVYEDITERKNAENALAASEKKLKSLIDSQTHFVLRINLEGKYTYWNPKFESEFGWLHQSRGIQNASAMDTICPYHQQRVLTVVESCIAQPGKVFSVELDKPARDGSVRTTLWEFMCLTDEHNQPSEIQCMGIEITDRKKVEDALRESEEKYRGLMESLDSAIATVDCEGNFLYVNNVAANILGRQTEELIGKNMLEIFPAPLGERQLVGIQKVIAEDAARVFESPSLGMGKENWYRFSIQPLHDESGKANRVLINVTDIHELKSIQHDLEELNSTLEQRIKQRTAEIQDLYDNAPIGYHSVDVNGRVVVVNRTELNWLGYEKEEVIGRPISDFFTLSSKEVFRENFPILKERGWVRDIEIEIIRKDGSMFPVLINGLALYDETGKYVMSRSTVFDITGRKKAEQSLRESEEQNRKLFDMSPDSIILLDESARVVRMNHAFELLSGVPESQFIGHTADEMGLLTREQMEQLARTTVNSLHLNDNYAATEFKFKRANGEVRDLGARLFALKIMGLQHYLITVRDITFEKKTEEALRLANAELERTLRLKDEFLANMSHELRTPLNAILGLSESLLEQIAGPLNEKQRRYLDTISESGHHLLNLINDILDLAKVEAGQITLDISDLEIDGVCESSLRMIRQLAQKKKQNVEVDIEKGIGRVRADERRLKQIIVNLLSNAVKFTPEGGALGLKVSVDREDSLLLLTVWDHGIGIREGDVERLFQPFVQLDAGLARESSGTGLGLALVAQMARLHGGSISVTSEVGHGSKFTVILPWRPVNGDGAKKQDVINGTTSKLSQAEKKKTILLVDDTESILMLYGEYLGRYGYKVEVAMDGIEGIRKAIELHPDLILMDVMMPGLDGLQATNRIRQEESLRHVPVIALTALAMPTDRQRCLEAGMNDYLSKPVGLNELLNLVKKYLVENG